MMQTDLHMFCILVYIMKTGWNFKGVDCSAYQHNTQSTQRTELTQDKSGNGIAGGIDDGAVADVLSVNPDSHNISY